jgi:periplasmic protein TonB
MKKIFPLIIVTMVTLPAFAQEIVNLVLIGKDGITENIKEAHSFVVVKRYPLAFTRLDYKIGAPLEKVRNYSDSLLKVLNGPYYEYTLAGAISKRGYYENNLKERSWYSYDDTAKVILEEKYEKGILIKTINPDTVKNKSLKDDKYDHVDKEAIYKKSDKDWINYLSKNLNAELGNKSVKGGQVRVGFTVDTSGKCVDIYLRRSVEFVLDEEVIRVIEKSPLWNPAIQYGKKVRAFRVQPITFSRYE